MVETGYDRVAESYRSWAARVSGPARVQHLETLLGLLPHGAAVLELGCGNGEPVTRRLIEAGHVVTAVDISERQLALAREVAPPATYIHADFATLELPTASFDAVAAFYSLIHVPREELTGLLRRVFGWLRPGGAFVATMGGGDDPGTVEPDWLGAPMYWSHFGPDVGRELIAAAGFDILSAEIVEDDEDGTPVPFLWVVASRPT
ncbi:MAG: class I SAM-dependent methyltransferase [Chloroflexota bacterium]